LKLLLDTHVFMWWDHDEKKLSQAAFDAISDPRNEVLFSVVTVWEMIIKTQIGKLSLRRPLAEILRDQQSNRLRLLAVELSHVLAVEPLPPIHRDPFDRLLIAQAVAEGASLVSADGVFGQYPVSIVW
jgi:PIN domain nuclease of toxin-antitoxin system